MSPGINKGFETMIPKNTETKSEEDDQIYRNLINFKLFKRKFKILLEVSEE